MARSDAVWVVIYNRRPVAAFTVKRELRRWLKGLAERSGIPEGLSLFRVPDGLAWGLDAQRSGGLRGAARELSIAEVLDSPR